MNFDPQNRGVKNFEALMRVLNKLAPVAGVLSKSKRLFSSTLAAKGARWKLYVYLQQKISRCFRPPGPF